MLKNGRSCATVQCRRTCNIGSTPPPSESWQRARAGLPTPIGMMSASTTWGLTAFMRFDPYDHSRLTWAEARYHWEHAGIAVQWQRGTGDAKSDFALWPVRQSWLALVDYYF